MKNQSMIGNGNGNGNTERGSAAIWIIVIFIVIALGVAGYLFALSQGFLEAPEFIANIPGIDQILPEKPEEAEGPVEMTEEESLKHQITNLMGDLQKKDTEIGGLTGDLAERDTRIAELQSQLDLIMDTISAASRQDIRSAATIHESMDAAASAKILSKLTPEEASLIIGAMRESKAGDILEEMDEDLAKKITSILAGFEETQTASGG